MSFGSSAAQRENFERLMKGYAPLSWWKFIETSGTNLADSGSSPHAATLNLAGTTGSLGVSTGPAVSSRRTTNNALRFVGGSASGSPIPAGVASSSSLYQIFGTSCTLTIGCFIKIISAGTSGFVHFPSKQATVGFRFTLTISSSLVGPALFDGTNTAFPAGATLPNDGAWHMVACTINRGIPGANGTGVSQNFLDGAANSALNLPAGFGTVNESTVNMTPLASNSTPTGTYDISDVFIIPQVLSTQQIRALYKAGVR